MSIRPTESLSKAGSKAVRKRSNPPQTFIYYALVAFLNIGRRTVNAFLTCVMRNCFDFEEVSQSRLREERWMAINHDEKYFVTR